MQTFFLPAVLTVGAGISVLIQQALNANLRSELNSAPWSGFMSYFLGVACMVALGAVLRDPVPSAATVSRVPLWAWSGGIFGAIFIALSIITIPKLGGAAYIALLVTGQMIAALAVDNYGWLGVPERHIDLPRMLGVALLVGSVVLIRR
jgi:bacterial/archaeal transporter family-2 protein